MAKYTGIKNLGTIINDNIVETYRKNLVYKN